MMIMKFKSHEEHDDLKKKVKKMMKFTEELYDYLEDCEEYDDDEDYRRGRYRDDYDERHMEHGGRYDYRRGGRGRM